MTRSPATRAGPMQRDAGRQAPSPVTHATARTGPPRTPGLDRATHHRRLHRLVTATHRWAALFACTSKINDGRMSPANSVRRTAAYRSDRSRAALMRRSVRCSIRRSRSSSRSSRSSRPRSLRDAARGARAGADIAPTGGAGAWGRARRRVAAGGAGGAGVGAAITGAAGRPVITGGGGGGGGGGGDATRDRRAGRGAGSSSRPSSAAPRRFNSTR
jgi:hypothetical protein